MSNEVTTDAGSNSPTTTAGTGTPPAQSAAAPQVNDWMSGFDPQVKDYLTTKGLTDPKLVAQSYVHLEKLMGGGPKSFLKLPTKPDDKEALGTIWNQLGRPEKPEEYMVQVPEGHDKVLAESFAKKAHELGLSRKQVEGIVAFNNLNFETTQKVQDAALGKAKTEAEATLKAKWGAAYDQNMNIAKKALGVEELGLSEEKFVALEQALGTAGTIEFLHTVMSKTMQDQKFETGSNGAGFGGSILSPQQAQEEISKLGKDKDFMRRWMSGDVEASSRMDGLNKMAIGLAN